MVARRQLLCADTSRDTIARLLARGWLQEVHPLVYAVGHRRLSEEGRLAAALLYAGPGAALSHATAAWWWELTSRKPRRIELSTRKRCDSRANVRVYGRRTIDRLLHRSLPVTSVAQTLIDYAATHEIDDVRYVLSEADYRGVLKLDELDAALGRGRPGSQTLRKALDRHRPELALARSELERRFLALCEQWGLPIPRINAKVCGFTVDAYWPEEGVVVELDGHQGHRTKAQLERDHGRDLRLRAGGLTALRYTWGQVLNEPPAVHADLSAALRG